MTAVKDKAPENASLRTVKPCVSLAGQVDYDGSRESHNDSFTGYQQF